MSKFQDDKTISFYAEITPIDFMQIVMSSIDERILHSSKDKIRVAIPLYIIELMNRQMGNGQYYLNGREWMQFSGWKVIENYNNSIVVYHVDYPLYKEKWMKTELELEWFINRIKERNNIT